jgi:UPF0716 protein FxsA
MRRGLLALVIVFPAIELWGIVEIGRRIGGWQTLLLLIVSGLLGAWLAQVEGRRVWLKAKSQMQAGQMPGHALLDGLCVLAGGILLLVPGFVSDAIGLTMLFPLTRPLYRMALYRLLEKRIRSGSYTFRRDRF